MNTKKNIRVRFAPSPTGYLHVGGLRTALYNYLFAKNKGGTFILRIEDTDQNRYVEGAVDNLINSLRWAGLEFDEGPGKEGPHSPYLQSQRLELYREHAEQLIKEGKAYYCFCSTERLQALRKEQEARKEQPMYDKHCLSLPEPAVKEKLSADEPHVVRMNIPKGETVVIEDTIRGRVEFESGILDDQVLLKSDGFPTYHLANVVDDHHMEISHVIRGEEWLPSTPKHALLYDFFGWERPVFAHLPLLLNPDKSKLSKRQGDVAVEDYRAKGYLKEALVNFVALLGWTAGDDKEFYTMDELINAFSLERVNKAGAVFNVEKLNWLNGEHLRSKTDEELLTLLKQELSSSPYSDKEFSNSFLLKVITSMKERVLFVKEFIEKAPYFYEAPNEYDPAVKAKRWKEDSAALLKEYAETLEQLSDPVKEDYDKALHALAEKHGIGLGKVIHPLRLAVSGTGAGPGVFDILDAVGKEESINRIKTAVSVLQ